MGRQIDCPFEEHKGSFIVLPDQWQGRHLQRRDQAIEKSLPYDSQILTELSICLAILDDWSIPGLTGNPENWDFLQLDAKIINWIREATISDFAECFKIPKV